MGSLGVPTLNHQKTIINEIEKVENAELKKSRSRKEEVTSLEARAGELYGTSLASRFLKDYNSMNIWLSVNPSSFMASESRFPKF